MIQKDNNNHLGASDTLSPEIGSAKATMDNYDSQQMVNEQLEIQIQELESHNKKLELFFRAM